MAALSAPATYPFAIAALILVGLVLVEIVAMLVGFSLSTTFDVDAPGHSVEAHHEAGVLGAWMSWLNAGGVPLLVLLMIWLASFAIMGYAIQGVAAAVLAPLPVTLASLGAALLALPAGRTLSRLTARIIPREETAAVSQAEFIGLTGVVVLGPLDQGKPGQVRVRDLHGNLHVLRARAAEGHTIPQGAAVLVVDGKDGLFQTIPAPGDLGASPPSQPGT